jgi:hypothetical protein
MSENYAYILIALTILSYAEFPFTWPKTISQFSKRGSRNLGHQTLLTKCFDESSVNELDT